MARIELVYRTSTEISCILNQLDTSYQGYDRICYWHLDGVHVGTVGKLPAHISLGGQFTFKNLSPNTKYIIYCNVTFTDYLHGNVQSSITIGPDEIETTISRPSNWNWSEAERFAFDNKGSVKALTRERWNAFIDCVNAFVIYVNYRDKSELSSISESDYMGTDRCLSGVSFTTVARVIESISKRRFDKLSLPQSKGMSIRGDYFNELSLLLNSII